MRQIVIVRHGAPEVLQAREAPDPAPGEGEVRIAVRAAGVNFADVLARIGLYPDAPKPPVVVGYEVSGVIDAVGPGVTTHREGDRAVALTHFGGYADRVVVPEGFAFSIPNSLGDAEAAAIPVNYLTALIALYRMANISAGETVLIHGAGGGVGIAATARALAWRDDPGHRVGGETRRDPAARRRSCDRLSDRGRDPQRPTAHQRTRRGCRAGSDRRAEFRRQLSAARAARAAGDVRRSIAPGERRSLWRALVTIVRMPVQASWSRVSSAVYPSLSATYPTTSGISREISPISWYSASRAGEHTSTSSARVWRS